MQIRYQLRRTAVRVATLLLWELQFASTDPIAAERTNLLMAALGAAYPTVLVPYAQWRGTLSLMP